MVLDPRKRQKKLERRKAKQKAERQAQARRESRGLPARLREASTAPILHCCINRQEGMGNVLFSRQLKNGDVAFSSFLVDFYCLGVKDAFSDIAPRATYERNLYFKFSRQGPLVVLKPECARKMIEGAVRYASGLGLPPHPDYATAALIFGDVTAESCTEEFEYGKDGKPLFIGGPCDDPHRCRQILRTLEERCGPDGYHYLIPIEESALDEWDFEEAE